MDFELVNKKVRECAALARACGMHHVAAELGPTIWFNEESVDALKGRIHAVQVLVGLNRPKGEMASRFISSLYSLGRDLGDNSVGHSEQLKIA